jgi:hypothetical protein
VPSKCHPCTNCPKCKPDGGWPDTTAIVEQMCLGKNNCTIPVDFQVFGDPCEGKKVLAVQVQCSSTPALATVSTPQAVAYRHTVTIPPGSIVDIDVPLLGHSAGEISIIETGRLVWQNGTFVAGVEGLLSGSTTTDRLGTMVAVRFAAAQGSYVFELLV